MPASLGDNLDVVKRPCFLNHVLTGDLMVKNPHIVYPEDKLTRAREIMRDTGVRVLPVVNEELIFLGVVYRLDILNVSSSRSDLLIRDVINEPAVKLSPDTLVVKALADMINVDEWYAPVVDNKNILRGMLGLENVIKTCLLNNNCKEFLSKVKLKDICTREVEHLKVEDEVTRVWYLMIKKKFAGFPVVRDDGVLIGVVTQYDLLKKGYARIELESESKPRKLRVRDVMTTPAIGLKEEESALKAAEVMIKMDIGRVYLIDDSKRLVGVVDREDIIKILLGE